MTPAERADKEMEVIAWMNKKGYDRRASKEIAPIIVTYLDEVVKNISSKQVVSCRYSVSLVYEKEIINGFSTQIDTAIRVLITEAENENEALGKAIKNFEKEMKDYGMKMKVVLPTQNYGS